MNDTIKGQLNHRTIRKFQQEELSKDTFELLMKVAQRTATSNFMQSYSIIHVTDQSLKEQIASICNQAYVAEAPCLLIFVADHYRNQQIALEDGANPEILSSFDRFLSASTDAVLAAQNVVIAAESLGYGTVYLGSIGNDAQKIIDLLKLPERTFPVLGLGIGKAAEEPSQKPRLPEEVVVHENTYKKFNNMHQVLKEYDQVVTTYYDSRDLNNRLDSFTHQISQGMERKPAKRHELLNVARKQNLIIK